MSNIQSVLKLTMSNKISQNTFISFLPFAVVTTFLSFLIFVVVQQNIRLSTNDQIAQIAEDTAGRIAPQNSIPSDFPTVKIDIARSLSTYVIVYDANKKIIGSTGSLDGNNPDIPVGVLNAAHSDENRVTWQPRKGIRSAIVAVYFKGKSEGFVVAGKSLREVEKREELLQTQVGIGWLFTLFISYITTHLALKIRRH